ncbi:MAG: hypothetical protein H6719_24845 [Sandaracinaceae bacterium]|nr:hypothetical protein [Sandaracinaceae bacterium]
MPPRVAVVSLHSHGDRSFLDDRGLALVAGDLRAGGVDADLVVGVMDAEAALDPLVEALSGYGVVVYERVWSVALIEALRARLEATFVSCEGEHALADPPADFVCAGDLRATVPALVAHLAGDGPLPRRARARTDEGEWIEGLGKATARAEFTPVLHPVVVGSETWSAQRTFSVEGNAGCPYGADARDNPMYAGAVIPEGYGRGCAFCTTGNRSESAPPAVTADKVMTQLRYLRREAPELTRLVLKDQNPFGWLTEVVERCAEEGLGGFSLLLETRADWFLRNRRRFERALEVADGADLRLCPFLVGIESFSQPELDRFNKGTTAEANEAFLEALFAWDAAHPSLDLSHAAFGFVLLTPWTRMDDIRANLEAVERTGFDRLRGHLLVSKARLYPDTALYYLGHRDDFLVEAHERDSADNSRRYGYFPETPWRFADPEVARFAEVAAELTARHGGSDERRLWRALLDAFDAAERPELVTADAVERRLARPDPGRVRERLAKLVAPLDIDAEFADGWRFGPLSLRPRGLSIALEHAREGAVTLDIAPRAKGPRFARSRHYDLRHTGSALSPAQDRALRAVCAAIVGNDR